MSEKKVSKKAEPPVAAKAEEPNVNKISTGLTELANEAQKYDNDKEFREAFLMKKLWKMLPINTLEHRLARDLQDVESGKKKASPVVLVEKAIGMKLDKFYALSNAKISNS